MKKLYTNAAILFLLIIPSIITSPKHYESVNFNITFVPDLSNRLNQNLYPRPLNDVQILSSLLKNIYPNILKNDRDDYQTDKFSVDFINKKLINIYHANPSKMTIDFGQFGDNQAKRIGYILSRPGFEHNNLGLDIKSMENEYKRVNTIASKQYYGADVWTYLNEGIDDHQIVLKADPPLKDDEGNVYVKKYRNILILLTDGYIEAGIYNKGFDLSQKYINNFRNAFLKSGEQDLKKFFNKNKQYRIKSVNNPNLKNLEILVLELYDRSTNKNGEAAIHPTDMEIIKLFWSDWLKQAGVKHCEFFPTMKSPKEAENVIMNFLNIKVS